MRRIIIAIVAAGALAGLVSYLGPASGQADQEASPIYGISIPKGYRNWQLISVNHLSGGNLKQVRAQLGNDIAIKAFQEGKLPFPDGRTAQSLPRCIGMTSRRKKTTGFWPWAFPAPASNLSLPGPL